MRLKGVLSGRHLCIIGTFTSAQHLHLSRQCEPFEAIGSAARRIDRMAGIPPRRSSIQMRSRATMKIYCRKNVVHETNKFDDGGPMRKRGIADARSMPYRIREYRYISIAMRNDTQRILRDGMINCRGNSSAHHPCARNIACA